MKNLEKEKCFQKAEKLDGDVIQGVTKVLGRVRRQY